MDELFEEYKGKKLRVSTNQRDFEGTLTDYHNGYITLEDSFQIISYGDENQRRRRIGKAHISFGDVEYYSEAIKD